MLILECPYCGVRAEETELSPGYEAHLKRYGPGSSDAEFEAYMFARKNPKGVLKTVCCGCLSPHNEQYNPFLYCVDCHVRFHKYCYSVSPDGLC